MNRYRCKSLLLSPMKMISIIGGILNSLDVPAKTVESNVPFDSQRAKELGQGSILLMKLKFVQKLEELGIRREIK